MDSVMRESKTPPPSERPPASGRRRDESGESRPPGPGRSSKERTASLRDSLLDSGDLLRSRHFLL